MATGFHVLYCLAGTPMPIRWVPPLYGQSPTSIERRCGALAVRSTEAGAMWNLTVLWVLGPWALCGLPTVSYRAHLDAASWQSALSRVRAARSPAAPLIELPVCLDPPRHRAMVEVYYRKTRPSRHSPEYFHARDTDTAEFPVIRSD